MLTRAPALPENSDSTEALARSGALEARFAQGPDDVRRAQELRYRVFYQEGRAIADAHMSAAGRDADTFDAICDHLLVIDHAPAPATGLAAGSVVGTYRLLRQEIAEQHHGFYSEAEFGIGALIARHKALRFLELGRSCVLEPYRNKRTLELLWHGIGHYTMQHRPDVMMGCASLDGTDPDKLALQLSFLHHFAGAPEKWRASALPDRVVTMDRMPSDAIDQKEALRLLPPLIKGYLRLGACIGDGAVIDHQFGTTDVLIVLPVADIKSKYVAYFHPNGRLEAA
jgi:putative hemolysin